MPDFNVIGAQKMCLNVINSLDVREFDAYLIVQDGVGKLLEDLSLKNPPIILKRNSKGGLMSKVQTLIAPVRLANYLNKIRPEIIVSISPTMNILLLLSSIFFKYKNYFLVIEEHQHLSTSIKLDRHSHSRIMSLFYKKFINVYNRADILKVVSQSSKTDFIENWGIDEMRVKVVNPPINSNELIAKGKDNIPDFVLDFIGVSKYFFSLGRIEEQKDFNFLLRSFQLLINRVSDVKLVICGDGSLRKYYVQYVKNNGLSNKILFTSYIDNPYPLFRNATAFCLSSIWEGMPVVIMESMILKCPVISVDCPSGPNEMIQNKVNGLLVNRSIEDFADAMQFTIENPDMVEQWKTEAFDVAINWDSKCYIDTFKKIINP